MKTSPVAAAILLWLIATGAVHAQRVIYVDRSAPAGGDGASWSGAFNDLQVALAAANNTRNVPLVEVRVAQGTYTPAPPGGSRLTSFLLQPNVNSLFLIGAFAGRGAFDPDARDPVNTPTTLSGDLNGDDQPGFVNRADNSSGVVRFDSNHNVTALRLDGLTIRGGNADLPTRELGGGVSLRGLVWTPQSVIVDCVITDNQCALDGGGAYLRSGGIVVSHSTVTGNLALRDGGGLVADGITSIQDCTITRNQARDGGGVVLSITPIHRSIVAANVATRNGGGLKANRLISSCLIVGNTAGAAGGGVYGGGPFCCTITGNRAAWGGGLHCRGSDAGVNTIYHDNHASIAGQNISFGEYYIIARYCVIDGGGGDAIFTAFGGDQYLHAVDFVDPRFVDADGPDDDAATWEDNDYHLLPGSPCIDAGDDSPFSIPSELQPGDVAGRSRPAAATSIGIQRYDIGAHEYQLPRYCLADFNNDGDVGTDADIRDFFAALSGTVCPTCHSPDFDGDGDVGTDADIESFFRVLAGGPC